MSFSDLTKMRASYRQSKWDGWGSWCAKCGTALAGETAEVTQRTPTEKGGDFSTANCVVLCTDCFTTVKDHEERLSDAEIPYYNKYPEMWHGNTDYVINNSQTSSGVKF